MNRRTEQKRNKWASRQLLLGIVISSSFFFHSPIRRLCYKFFFATPKLSMSNEIYRLIVCAYNTDSCLFLCIWSWVINRERQKKYARKKIKPDLYSCVAYIGWGGLCQAGYAQKDWKVSPILVVLILSLARLSFHLSQTFLFLFLYYYVDIDTFYRLIRWKPNSESAVQ